MTKTAHEELSALTGAFRESLANDSTSSLRCIEGKALVQYIIAFTRIWETQSDEMKGEMRNIWVINCDNLLIKGGIHCGRKVGKIAPISFRNAIFDSDVYFRGIKFLSVCDFSGARFSRSSYFEDSEFNGKACFNCSVFDGDVNFSKTWFRSEAEFQQLTLSAASISFTGATFFRAPLFHESKLPQGTSFDESRFLINTSDNAYVLEEDARAFRTLKQLAASYRGQQDEADFFSYEQTARRAAFMAPRLIWPNMPFHLQQRPILEQLLQMDTWRNWNAWTIRCKFIEWAISIAYEQISGYGRKAHRAIFWLFMVNFISAFLFRFNYYFGDCKTTVDYCTLNSSATSFAYQHPAAQLAIQNILNPVALASEKAVIYVYNPSMLALSMFQFVATYLILILLALAIRTRFQKGSGGER